MVEPRDLPYSMKMIFKRVVTSPLGMDARTDWANGTILGNTHDVNRRDVLQSGLADFKTGYRHHGVDLSCSEKALLYCHYYLKYTFFACKQAFVDARSMSNTDDHPLCLFDVGCGPGTAALALSDTWPPRRLVYVGIDESKAMVNLASQILNEGLAQSLIAKGTDIHFKHRWSEIEHGLVPKDAQVLIVLSFFLGSPSLSSDDMKHLAEWISWMAGAATRSRPAICFVNSPHCVALERLQRLKTYLRDWISLVPLTTTEVHYFNYGRTVGRQPVVYECGFPG